MRSCCNSQQSEGDLYRSLRGDSEQSEAAKSLEETTQSKAKVLQNQFNFPPSSTLFSISCLNMNTFLHFSASTTELPIPLTKLLFNLFTNSLLWIFSITSQPHPLLSASAATAVILLLYFPRNLLFIFISPVLLSAVFLLIALFRFGSPQTRPEEEILEDKSHRSSKYHTKSHQSDHFFEKYDSKEAVLPADDLAETEDGSNSSSRKSDLCGDWVGWGGPLEIIYEKYEGEEEEAENDEFPPEYSKFGWRGFEEFCYSSDDEMEGEESTENGSFGSDEEGEGLIEIVLEEDSMFEINLSACW